jgi:hypothetical protein
MNLKELILSFFFIPVFTRLFLSVFFFVFNLCSHFNFLPLTSYFLEMPTSPSTLSPKGGCVKMKLVKFVTS